MLQIQKRQTLTERSEASTREFITEQLCSLRSMNSQRKRLLL